MKQQSGETWFRTSAQPRPHACHGNDRRVRTCTQARDFARQRLAEIRPADENRTDDLLLVVSELATNAQRHAGGIIDFRLDVARDSATVSVTDASSDVPSCRRNEELTPGGFGWPIVLRLSREVTVSVHPGGKTILAVVSLAA